MAYASPSIVYRRTTGRTFTASSKPSTTDVVDFLESVSGELDGILRARGYSLPIATTATSALKLLEDYAAMGAIVRVEQAAQTPSNSSKDALKLWEQAKKMLASGQVELEAAKDTAQATPRSGAGATSAFAGLEDWC